MRTPNRLLPFIWLVAILLISSCGQQPTKTEQEPSPVVRPSNAVIESVVDASLVDSFGLSLSSQDGKYVFSGEWELDPDEDPNTVYWVLAGTADGGFIPVKWVTSAEAAANSMVVTNELRSLGRVVFLDGEVRLMHDFLRRSTTSPDDDQPDPADHFTQLMANIDLIFMLLKQGAGDSVDSEETRNTFGAMQEALDAFLSENREVQEGLEFHLQRLVEDARAAAAEDSRSWFDTGDTGRQLLSAEEAERLQMIREGPMSRTPQVLRPSFDPAELQLRIEKLALEREEEGVRRAQEQAQMRATLRERLSSATLTTPDKLHELVVCGYEDGPFEYHPDEYQGALASCNPDPTAMLIPVFQQEDWVPGATSSMQLLQRGSEFDIFEYAVVSMLRQPGVTITFQPSDDPMIHAAGGESLTVYQRHDGQEFHPFSIVIDGLPLERQIVTFRVKLFDSDDDVIYEDYIQLDLSHEKFRVAPD